MPSIRKRIGYLPSITIQEIITNISKREKLSQSKVVGILVKEALLARGLFDLNNRNNYSFKYSDLDELISDKGITYNKRKNKYQSNELLS